MSSKALKQSCGKSRSPDSITELKLLKLLNTSKDYLNISVVYVRLIDRGTQREYSSKPLEHSIVKRILEFKR